MIALKPANLDFVQAASIPMVGLDAGGAHPPREGYTFHGLRASSVENLREAGCDDAGVESITGMSQAMIRRYSRFVDQRRLAKAAVLRLERTGRER